MNVSKRDILIVLGFIFIILASTVPFIDAAGIRFASSRFVTLFDFIRDYILMAWRR